MIIRKPFYVTAFTIATLMLLVLGAGISLAAFDLPTETPMLDSTALQATWFREATQIIGKVTANSATSLAGTVGAVATSFPPTLTRTPTATATPILPLSAQVGFSDPELDKLEAAKYDVLEVSLDFAGNGHQYRLLSIGRSKPLERESFPYGKMVLLVQMDAVHPAFLWEHDYAKQNGLVSFLADDNHSWNSAGLPFPGEWNGDGKVFFAVGGGTPVQHDHRNYIFIYEIKADGTVVSRLKNAIPPHYGVIKIERQKDNTLLLWAIHTDLSNFACLCGPLPARPFTWMKDKITNAAPSHWDSYEPNPYSDAIGWEIYHLTTMTGSAQFDDYTFSEILLELLVHYDAIDQRHAGWQLAQDLVKEAKESHRLAEGTYIDQVFMPTMTQLYESHRTFVPVNLANLSQPEVGFYDHDGE